VSEDFTVSLTWWMHVPLAVVEVVVPSGWSSHSARWSRVVHRLEPTSAADVGVPMGPGGSYARQDGPDVQRVHGRVRQAPGL
jgi:hypothetical protein